MKHLINKQVIELDLNSKKDAIQWQARMSQFYWNDILPALEQVFDELSLDGEIISVEKMELDLGIIPASEMNKASLDDRFLELIRQQVREQLQSIKSAEKTGQSVQETHASQGRQSTMATKHTTALGISRQWLFYMKHGWLPWNAFQVNGQWFDSVLEAFATDYTGISELRYLVTHSAVLRKRIVLQHHETFLVKLLEVLTASKQSGVIQIIKQLINTYQAKFSAWEIASLPLTEIKTLLWEKALLLAAVHQQEISADQLSAALVDTNKITDQEPGATAAQEQPESLFIENAGLVLLHPFISMFFQRLGLVREGKFAGSMEQEKAMYLLHYLVTGNEMAEEFELVLPKILCQWPAGEPVSKAVEILPEELDEAEALLEEVIAQWAVLKNTDPGGLRAGFLQRKGKLYRKNDNAYLAVATSSIDVLLDHLPWSIGMVKFPWMKELLWVEWR